MVGDKGFDGEAQRQACAAIGAEAVIPAKSNRVDPEPLDRPPTGSGTGWSGCSAS